MTLQSILQPSDRVVPSARGKIAYGVDIALSNYTQRLCLLAKANSIQHGGLELSILENDVQFVGGIAHNVGQRHSRPSISEEHLDSEVGYGDCAHDRADLEL
jgi:hypothetical protein